LGILQDKDGTKMGALLAPLAGRIVLTTLSSERSLAPAQLLPVCRRANGQAPVVICASLAEAMAQVENDPLIVMAGSLYLVGEAMELLGLSPEAAAGEWRLNEWGAPAELCRT